MDAVAARHEQRVERLRQQLPERAGGAELDAAVRRHGPAVDARQPQLVRSPSALAAQPRGGREDLGRPGRVERLQVVEEHDGDAARLGHLPTVEHPARVRNDQHPSDPDIVAASGYRVRQAPRRHPTAPLCSNPSRRPRGCPEEPRATAVRPPARPLRVLGARRCLPHQPARRALRRARHARRRPHRPRLPGRRRRALQDGQQGRHQADRRVRGLRRRRPPHASPQRGREVLGAPDPARRVERGLPQPASSSARSATSRATTTSRASTTSCSSATPTGIIALSGCLAGRSPGA